MRVALIKSGLVENIIEAGPDYVSSSGHQVMPHETANIGDRFLNGEHIPAIPPDNPKDLLLAAAEYKAVTMLDNKASIHVTLPARNLTLDVALGGDNIAAIGTARSVALNHSERLFRRHFPQADGDELHTVTLTAAEMTALHNHIAEYQEAVQNAAAEIIDEIKSGRITKKEQIHNDRRWPTKHTGLELHG